MQRTLGSYNFGEDIVICPAKGKSFWVVNNFYLRKRDESKILAVKVDSLGSIYGKKLWKR